jgi:hypothetical protein
VPRAWFFIWMLTPASAPKLAESTTIPVTISWACEYAADRTSIMPNIFRIFAIGPVIGTR